MRFKFFRSGSDKRAPVWNDFAKPKDLDPKKHEKIQASRPPRLSYTIFFTPRSGSSWLSSFCEQTKHLGSPSEYFNPNFMSDISRSICATSLDEYCRNIAHWRKFKGVFGFEITHHQLRRVFGTDAMFHSYFPSTNAVWLIREDIVLQAVSLMKMVQMEVTHSTALSAADVATREGNFSYDGDELKRWLDHIRSAELMSESFFATYAIEPLRLSYERNMAVRPRRVMQLMRAHLGLPAERFELQISEHSKIGTDRNRSFADRFCEEEPALVAKLTEERQPMLTKIDGYQLGASRLAG